MSKTSGKLTCLFDFSSLKPYCWNRFKWIVSTHGNSHIKYCLIAFVYTLVVFLDSRLTLFLLFFLSLSVKRLFNFLVQFSQFILSERTSIEVNFFRHDSNDAHELEESVFGADMLFMASSLNLFSISTHMLESSESYCSESWSTASVGRTAFASSFLFSSTISICFSGSIKFFSISTSVSIVSAFCSSFLSVLFDFSFSCSSSGLSISSSESFASFFSSFWLPSSFSSALFACGLLASGSFSSSLWLFWFRLPFFFSKTWNS